MQDNEAGQQLLRGLSSTCDELSTSTTRRDQELQSLSDLLQSIKHLQDQVGEVCLPTTHLLMPAVVLTQGEAATACCSFSKEWDRASKLQTYYIPWTVHAQRMLAAA